MKRGASQIIAAILLIGFAVTVAMLVMNWATKHAEETTESIIGDVEGGINCEKVRINVLSVDETCSKIRISNNGYLKIEQVLIRSLGENQIEVIPMVQGKRNQITCKDSSIILPCQDLSQSVSLEYSDEEIAPKQEACYPSPC